MAEELTRVVMAICSSTLGWAGKGWSGDFGLEPGEVLRPELAVSQATGSTLNAVTARPSTTVAKRSAASRVVNNLENPLARTVILNFISYIRPLCELRGYFAA